MSSGAITTIRNTIDHVKYFPEKNRYVFISSKSCPYAHRIEILRNYKGLNNIIDIVYCDPVFRFDTKWTFAKPLLIKDKSFSTLTELYLSINPEYKDRFSLPVLYDTVTHSIVNNESGEILKILNVEFNDCLDNEHKNLNIYPESLTDNITTFVKEFEEKIGTGTYKAGHAKTMEDYKMYYDKVFLYLDQLNSSLEKKEYKYMLSNDITFADICVYPHLIRFDCIFYDLFCLNKQYLRDYQYIKKYLDKLSSLPAFSETLNLEEMKRGAYLSENNLPKNLGCVKNH